MSSESLLKFNLTLWSHLIFEYVASLVEVINRSLAVTCLVSVLAIPQGTWYIIILKLQMLFIYSSGKKATSASTNMFFLLLNEIIYITIILNLFFSMFGPKTTIPRGLHLNIIISLVLISLWSDSKPFSSQTVLYKQTHSSSLIMIGS